MSTGIDQAQALAHEMQNLKKTIAEHRKRERALSQHLEEKLQEKDYLERAKTSHGRVSRDGKLVPESTAPASSRTGKMLFSRLNQPKSNHGQGGVGNASRRPNSSISGRPSLGTASRGREGQATAQLVTDLEDLVLNQGVPHFKSPATHDTR